MDSNQYLGRLDHRFSDSDRVFGRYVIVDSNWGNVPLTSVGRFVTDYRAPNLGFGYSTILSPTKVNDFRFGMNRMRDVTSGLQTDTDFTQRDLGLDLRVVGDGNRPLSKFEEGLPSIGITGFSGINSGDASFNTKIVYEWSDNLSINRGRHNFKFGGLFRHNVVDFGGSNLPRGQINFTRDIVGIPDAFAAFMLGVPLSANSAQGVPLGFIRQKTLGIYALDDWKVTNRLTINLGVRWDWFGPVTDSQGKLRTLSYATGEARTINGRLVPMLVPNPNVSKQLYEINWRQVMPRLGIAYRLSDSLVLRTGAGQF